MDIFKELSCDEIDELSISEMKTILQQAALITEEDESSDVLWNITSNAMYILSIAGKRQIYDLVPELYKLLDHWDPYLREPAVANLGWWLKVPEFKERVYEIFVNDENHNVKFSALQSWTSYYADTQNSSVLEELYKILINDNYYVGVRDVALMGIFDVIGVKSNFYDPYTSDLIRCNLPSEFNSKVEWKEVTDLLKKYAPNALKNYPIQWTKEDYEKAKDVAKEDALNLINEGWDESKIIRQITGSILSIEEVEELKRSVGK